MLLVGSAVANDAKASSNRRSEINKSRKVDFGRVDRVEDGVFALDRQLLFLLVVVVDVVCLFVSCSMT